MCSIKPFVSVLLLVGLFVSVGCAGYRPGPPDQAHLIENVPFYPDDRYLCGPASLAGVMNYWGHRTSVREIASAVYSESARGTVPFDLVWFARQQGLKARSFEGSYSQMTAYLKQGIPLIVFVDLGYWSVSVPHFMVVVGFTDQGVIVNSGDEQHRWYARDDFVEMWEETGRWMLMVSPSAKQSQA